VRSKLRLGGKHAIHDGVELSADGCLDEGSGGSEANEEPVRWKMVESDASRW